MDRATDGPLDESSGARDVLLDLDLRRCGRMRRSLQEVLRTAIQEGRLQAATVLPSSRRLAGDLGVSRGVVTDAYDQLASEGHRPSTMRTGGVVLVSLLPYASSLGLVALDSYASVPSGVCGSRAPSATRIRC